MTPLHSQITIYQNIGRNTIPFQCNSTLVSIFDNSLLPIGFGSVQTLVLDDHGPGLPPSDKPLALMYKDVRTLLFLGNGKTSDAFL